MLSAGDAVEEFELLDQHGESVSLSRLLADGPAVLYFYIKAKTPG